MPGATAILLLPAPGRLGGIAFPDAVARALGRADRLPAGEPGDQAQLLRHFQLLPRSCPVAALTRAVDRNDAALSAWMRADPAYIRPEINGARLLACGEGMQLDRHDVAALLPALRPLFGDAGFPLDAPDPHRWYLRLPLGARLPTFASPSEALGTDLLDQLPGAGEDDRPEARRWRALLSEAQVVLHNHPHNAARVAAGRLPVNTLWFWGAGRLPDHVTTQAQAVASGDSLLGALGSAAGVEVVARPEGFPATGPDTIFDLRDSRDPERLLAGWLAPAIDALREGGVGQLLLDFGDGTRFASMDRQRWRFWRRPLRTIAP